MSNQYSPLAHSLPSSQGEVERRATIDGGLGPDPTAVPGDNAADGGQAHAGTLEFGRGVQTLEHPKQLVRVLHVEAGPVVPDQEDPLSVPSDRCEFDPGPRLVCGVLPTVAEQVLENPSQQPRVAPRFAPLG